MSDRTVAFPFHILQEHDKPQWAEPCNHCGLCCRVQACHVSVMFLKSEQAPCVALEVHDGKFMCGMILRPSHYLGITLGPEADVMLREGFSRLLDIGQGCTMPDEVLAGETMTTPEPIGCLYCGSTREGIELAVMNLPKAAMLALLDDHEFQHSGPICCDDESWPLLNDEAKRLRDQERYFLLRRLRRARKRIAA